MSVSRQEKQVLNTGGISMRKRLRIISAIIVLSMIFPLLSGLVQPVFAADIPIKVYIDSYDKTTSTVKLRWDAVSNVDSGTIEYHVPNGAGYTTVQVPVDKTKNTATITGIKSDIVYDFNVMLQDTSSQTFTGRQFFLAQISFYAEQVDQQPVNVAGGGVESGIYPTIKVTWNMPKVFNASNNTMAYANEALAQIDGSIKRLNFSISATADTSLANVIVKMGDDGQYTAVVSGDTNPARYSKVKFDTTTGKLSFYMMGVKDDTTLIPSIDDIRINKIDTTTGLATIPQAISSVGDNWYVLPHAEVRPGTIYKMTMNTLFVDSLNSYVGTVVTGLTENPLIGALDYTYTPIRFQLTKDTFDNIYVRIHRINQGKVNMPRLYYEIQTSNVPADSDTSWTSRKKLDDTYFNGEYAITVITGINSKNTVYYRVLVKSDGVSDRIQSLKLPYTMQEDTARPPVPKAIVVSKVDLAQPPSGSTITDKSSNITISWDKPSNWDQIRGHLDKDIYFHFMISVNAKDLDSTPYKLEANGKNYGSYTVKYRLVKFVSANSPNIVDAGTKLVYTIKGYELFKGETENPQGNQLTIANPDNYPTYLLPNKTYYLQMYTTLAADRGTVDNSSKMSEKSLLSSFTTLSPSGRDVPIPNYLEWVKTTVTPGSQSGPANAEVQVRFDELKIDWSNYTSNHDEQNDAIIYDLYMSTRTEPTSFKKIGTTDLAGNAGDVDFTKQTLGSTTWVYATINEFNDINNQAAFGKYLAPNSTYYFLVKVRLKMVNEPEQKQSVETVLLPVTTPTGEPPVPDDSEKKPLAPSDFAIARDSNGNPMISGQTVTFEWTVQEMPAAYNLIATSFRVEPNTKENDTNILQDSIYKSYISLFGNKDNNSDNNSFKLTLNPNMNPLASNFTYDPKTKKCRYTIDTWLYPNKIYYFSLRSEIVDAGKTRSSVWISIPVTTSLIEPPSLLQAVSDCELGFYWFDTSYDLTAEGFQIRLKTSAESSYTTLAKSKYTIVKNGSIYYGRLLKLKPNTQYNIQVVRTRDNAVMSTLNRYTRNDYYQIDVKWQGYAIDPYSGFEIAVKTEDDSDYVVLNNDVDLEQYVDITTHTYPYYIEKSNSNLNTNYYTYSARIKLAPTKLPNGSIEHRPLKPNTKYYIKIRATKVDSSDQTAVTPSKYVGPVNTRTEFSQVDYDDDDNNTSVVAKFLDMVNKLEQNIYWDISKKNGVSNKVLVRDEKVINILEGYGNFTCTIDISQGPAYVYTDEIYLAKDILKAMRTNNRSVIIKARDAEFTITPDTFDPSQQEEFKTAASASGAKDVYLKVNNTQSASVQPQIPSGTSAVGKMNTFSVQAVSSKQTSTNINAQIKDKLYNDTTGLIAKKLEVIKNPNNTSVKGDAKAVETYLLGLLEDVRSELSYYLEDTLNGAGYIPGVLEQKYSIARFNANMGVKMPFKAAGKVNPYVFYENSSGWQKLTQNLKSEDGYLSYFVNSTGKYTLLSSPDIAATVPADNAAKPYISRFTQGYDLTAVFPGSEVSFNSALNVTVREGILLYELITQDKVDEQTDIKNKAKAYGLDRIINTTNVYRNLTRQEAAALVIRLYCQRTGADYDRLRASYTKPIKDDGSIAVRYAVPVYMCLQMQLMTLDSDSKFNPENTINRAGMIMVMQKMLEA